METWEAVLVGMAAVAILIWFAPGAKRAVKNSRAATSEDWKGVLLPLGLVIAFVVLLIALA